MQQASSIYLKRTKYQSSY